MPGGRPPKPTELKRLAGNPGKRKLNDDEPQFGQAGLSCPRWLNAEARKEWRRVAPLLKDKKVITAADRGALAAYCLSYSRWQAAEAALDVVVPILDKDGNEIGTRVEFRPSTLVPIVNKKGEVVGEKPVARPEVMIAQQYQRLMVQAAAKLGMDPSSRSKVSTVKQEAKNPILDQLQRMRETRRAAEGGA